MHKIRMGMLQVCSACQNDCRNCVTSVARHKFPQYQMTLEQLEAFLFVIRESNYRFERVWLNGFGEPLLWKHLEKGLELLSNSPNIDSVLIRSNGMNVDVLTDEMFENIDELSVSRYKTNRDAVDKIVAKYGSRVKVLAPAKFIKLKGNKADIPCSCICSGPGIIGDYALLHCGPVIFSEDTVTRLKKAGKITQEDIDNLSVDNWVQYARKFLGEGSVVRVKKGFLDDILYRQNEQDFAKRNMDSCRYCFGNRNFTSSGDFSAFEV